MNSPNPVDRAKANARFEELAQDERFVAKIGADEDEESVEEDED